MISERVNGTTPRVHCDELELDNSPFFVSSVDGAVGWNQWLSITFEAGVTNQSTRSEEKNVSLLVSWSISGW
jgi:hypothetical protein